MYSKVRIRVRAWSLQKAAATSFINAVQFCKMYMYSLWQLFAEGFFTVYAADADPQPVEPNKPPYTILFAPYHYYLTGRRGHDTPEAGSVWYSAPGSLLAAIIFTRRAIE
jgi:hypothetical protein